MDLNETDSIDMTKIGPALQVLDRVKQNFFKKIKRTAKFRIPSLTEIVLQNSTPIGLKNYALHCNTAKAIKNKPFVLTDFTDIFEGLDSNVPCDLAENLEKSIDEDLIEIYEEKPMSAVQNFTQYPEFGMETQMPYIENVSSYRSQILSPIQTKPPLQSSTPFKAAIHSSEISTPLKSAKKSIRTSSKKKSEPHFYKGSPIKRAFQRSFEIQQQKQTEVPMVRTVNKTDVLAFFMLSDYVDIFDNASVSENVTPKQPLKLDKFCVDKSDLFMDSSTNDESAIQIERVSPVRNDALCSDKTTDTHLTISEILYIVNDGNEKKDQVIAAGPSNVSPKQSSLRKLSLHDFTDIFDDECFATQSADAIQPVADDSEIIPSSQAPPVKPFKAQKSKQSSFTNLSVKPPARQLSGEVFTITKKRTASVESLKENESPGKNLIPITTSLQSAISVTRQISADIFDTTIESVTPKEHIFESPERSTASCATDDRSPSVVSGRTNISRLKSHLPHNILQMPSKTIPVFATRSAVVTSHTSAAMVNLENSFSIKEDTIGPRNQMVATNKIGKLLLRVVSKMLKIKILFSYNSTRKTN